MPSPPSPPRYGDGDESCTTLVSATLVSNHNRHNRYRYHGDETDELDGDGDDPSSVLPSVDPPPPVLAHAVPVWRKRRIILCLSVWALLAVAVAAVCIPLALNLSKILNPMEEVGPQVGTAVPTAPLTLSPTASPTITASPVTAQASGRPAFLSHHAVQWGKISSCNDDVFFSNNDLELHCGGGVLELVDISGTAECSMSALLIGGVSSNITDTSRASCRLLVPTAPIDTDDGRYFQEVTGTVLFTCRGFTDTERTATASLPDMSVSGCNEPVPEDLVETPEDEEQEQRRRKRKLLRSNNVQAHSSTDPQEARNRALATVLQSGGGASAFVSMGRYCKEREKDWFLSHELYLCEAGKRLMVSEAFGQVWNGPVPDIGSLLSQEEQDELDNGDGDDDDSNVRRKLKSMTRGGGQGRRRRKLQLLELVGAFWELADLESYCYNINTCKQDYTVTDACRDNSTLCTTAEATLPQCGFQIKGVRISNGDPRFACRSREQDRPPREIMWELVRDEFSPSHFVDRVSGQV